MRKAVIALTALSLSLPMATAADAHRTGYKHSHRYEQTDCRKRSGTTGLIVGAAGGALAGREIDGGRQRATGTVLGAALGALLGREVERNVLSRRC